MSNKWLERNQSVVVASRGLAARLCTSGSRRLHHLAVQIHPFLNGNGRGSRMLANIWLKRNRRPVTEWPEQVIGRESPVRSEYVQAIRAADDRDYEVLFELHHKFTASG